MHVLFKRIRNLNIPIDLQLHLFNHVILPIALYGCEIWKLAKLSKIYIMIFSDILLIWEKTHQYICCTQNWDGTQYELISSQEWQVSGYHVLMEKI